MSNSEAAPRPATRGRVLETIALAPVALGALVANAGAAQANDGGLQKASLKGSTAAVVGYEDALDAARANLKAGRVVEAAQSYHQALSSSPESIEALNGVAVCYDRLGNFETSRTFYETALGIDPQSPLLLNNYGYSLYLQGERTQAIRFLALAVATGDPDVQATAMRILAKIEGEGRSAPSRSLVENPQVQKAAATTPQPTPGQPQIVRTSAHEVRLVLGDAPQPALSKRHLPQAVEAATPRPFAPAILAEALGDSAAAILPVVAISAAEDRMIADAEAAAIRHDAMVAAVQAQRQMQALSAAQSAAVPAMMQAMIDLALGARPVLSQAALPSNDVFAPSRPVRPGVADAEWNRHQLLVVSAAPATSPRGVARATHSLLVAGIVPVRPDLQSAAQGTLPATEPIVRKRAFEQPFASDDARLNGFAERLHGGAESGLEVDEQVARLQALIASASTA